MFKLFLFIIIWICTFKSFAQLSLDKINFSKIGQKKIRQFINKQKHNHIVKFTDLKPSCNLNKDTVNFRKLEKKYLIKENIEKVWDVYTSENPAEIWNGKFVTFGLLYSMQANKLIYRGDKYSGLAPGHILYLNMKILKGLYNLALSFEITTISSLNKIIELSYVDCNKSRGIQLIKMAGTKEGYTTIIHTTYYKSNSKIRDRLLYPAFHRKAINEFHRNLKRKICI